MPANSCSRRQLSRRSWRLARRISLGLPSASNCLAKRCSERFRERPVPTSVRRPGGNCSGKHQGPGDGPGQRTGSVLNSALRRWSEGAHCRGGLRAMRRPLPRSAGHLSVHGSSWGTPADLKSATFEVHLYRVRFGHGSASVRLQPGAGAGGGVRTGRGGSALLSERIRASWRQIVVCPSAAARRKRRGGGGVGCLERPAGEGGDAKVMMTMCG